MNPGTCKLAAVFALCLCVLMRAEGMPKAAFKLNKVFDLKVNPDSSKAFLSPSGKTIFLLNGSRLSVVDWKSKVTTATKDFSALPCDEKEPTFSHWAVLPSESEAVASYCGQLFVVSLDTLSAKGPLNVSGEDVRMMAVSHKGDLVAANLIKRAGSGPPTNEVVVFETHNWQPIVRWPVNAQSLAFSPDSSLLAIGRSTVDAGKTVRSVGVEVRSLRTGGLTSQWSCDVNLACAGAPSFLPGHPGVLATTFRRDEDGIGLELWDVRDGKKLRKITFEGKEGGGPFLVSPDSRFVIGTNADDPGDSPEYTQDMIVWDLKTGEKIYETPKIRWTSLDRLAFAAGKEGTWFAKADFDLIGVSGDGKYLLVREHKHLALYEVVQ